METVHYSEPVANYMSDCFKTGKHKISKSSPYISLEALQTQYKEYELR